MGRFLDFLQLTESPLLDNSLVDRGDEHVDHFSEIDPKREIKLTPNVSVQDEGWGDKVYYHHVNGKPNVISHISVSDNDTLGSIKQQIKLHKAPSAPSQHVDELIRNIIEKEGTIHSDNRQTDGSKKLWLNLQSRIPGVEITHHNLDTGESVVADPDYLKRNIDKIWVRNSFKGENHILSAKFKE